MAVYCKKCKKKIEPYMHGSMSDRVHADVVLKITKLKWSDFHQKTASGGKRWEAKVGKYRICLFIDTGNNARIMIEGTGRWLASLDFEEETPEALLSYLQKVLKS